MGQIILETRLRHMEHEEVIGDSRHGFTGGKSSSQGLVLKSVFCSSWELLSRVVPVTNFLGGCMQPFPQQNAQFAFFFFLLSWIFLRVLIPLFGN